MIIPSIGKQKISYKDHKNIQFESLNFYTNLAQKVIAKMSPKFSSGLSKQMLKDEDAISFVANAIMMGDWRWKEKEDDTQPHKNLYSYRNQCAIWAIKTYITKQYKTKHNTKKINITHSLNYDLNDINLENIIADNGQNEPIDIIINNENYEICNDLISKLLDSGFVSERQKEYIKLYYFENMTLAKIGDRFNITREAVRQSIKTAIKKIRSVV